MRDNLKRRRFVAGLGAAAAANSSWGDAAAGDTADARGSGLRGVTPRGDAVAHDAADAPAYRTATDLLQALAARQISSRELADAPIARIEALDPRINAVVVRDFDRARAAAQAADAALARGERGALLGLPMAVKEQFNIAGLPTTWGIEKFRN
jgi:hypothetical protein